MGKCMCVCIYVWGEGRVDVFICKENIKKVFPLR